MKNPLHDELDVFLQNILLTNSMFSQSSTHLKNQKDALLKQFQGKEQSEPFIGTSLIIGDLTGPSERGYKINYHTGKSEIIKIKDVSQGIDLLISREGMRSVANCYEMLESFFFDFTASFLYNNPDHLKITNKLNTQGYASLAEYKEQLRNNYRGRNNGGILKLMKSLSGIFAESERPVRFNISQWYFVLSHLRHAIIHSQFIINKKKVAFSPIQEEILEHYLTYNEDEDFYYLNMTENESKRQITTIAEYGFHIFKCFSIEYGYDWQVLKNMKKNPL